MPTSKSPHSILQSPAEYAIAIVSSNNNPTAHTPVSSDDGFCGSSDISDPSIPNGNNPTVISYRQPYLLMKEGILTKNSHSPSFTSLSSANATETTRRVRFNLETERIHVNSPSHHVDEAALKRFEQIYITSIEDYDPPPANSTVV